jgi:hypothetical protein
MEWRVVDGHGLLFLWSEKMKMKGKNCCIYRGHKLMMMMARLGRGGA